MSNIFEIIDITTRKIKLTKERWQHIQKRHNNMHSIEEIKQAIRFPDTIKEDLFRKKIKHYQRYIKERKKTLTVTIKHLNGKGYIITAYKRR